MKKGSPLWKRVSTAIFPKTAEGTYSPSLCQIVETSPAWFMV